MTATLRFSRRARADLIDIWRGIARHNDTAAFGSDHRNTAICYRARMMNIHPETEELARLVAMHRGTTPEAVVRSAVAEDASALGLGPAKETRGDVRQAVKGAKDAKAKAELIAAMEAIAARSAARPSVDPRSIDEIVGYDDFGLPR